MRTTILGSVVLLAAIPALAEEPPRRLQDVPLQIERGGMERRDELVGAFDIEVESLVGSGDRTIGKVTIRNVSPHDLEEVELSCTAFDGQERELSTVPWRLAESGGGTMARGEARTIEIAFTADPTKVRSATCNARGW